MGLNHNPKYLNLIIIIIVYVSYISNHNFIRVSQIFSDVVVNSNTTHTTVGSRSQSDIKLISLVLSSRFRLSRNSSYIFGWWLALIPNITIQPISNNNSLGSHYSSKYLSSIIIIINVHVSYIPNHNFIGVSQLATILVHLHIYIYRVGLEYS